MAKPPDFYIQMKEEQPDLIDAYESLGRAAREAGPLDKRTQALVKLGLSIGAGLEGSTHSSVRKATAAGCSEDEIHHAVFLAVTTLGFPSMMRARAWAEDVLAGDSSSPDDET